MNKQHRPIEHDFMESILKIALISIIVVMLADYFFNRFFVIRSVIVNTTVLVAIVTTYLLYKRGLFTLAVLWIGFLIVGAMFYQSLDADEITTSSMAVVMVVGFGFSILLKGRMPLTLHVITILGMLAVFGWIALHPMQYGKPNGSDIIVAGITYLMLYLVIAYTAWKLRQRYDEALAMLTRANDELISKAHEIETQNEELVQSQENLFQLNNHLESLVEARTLEVKHQNERLIRYAFANAHHLRGPVARVLGLIQLSRLETNLDHTFLFAKVHEQVTEIDEVVKSITRELET